MGQSGFKIQRSSFWLDFKKNVPVLRTAQQCKTAFRGGRHSFISGEWWWCCCCCCWYFFKYKLLKAVNIPNTPLPHHQWWPSVIVDFYMGQLVRLTDIQGCFQSFHSIILWIIGKYIIIQTYSFLPNHKFELMKNHCVVWG